MLSCMSTTIDVQIIYSKEDFNDNIKNTSHTMYWVYCGRDDYKRTILKRYNGEYRDLNDPMIHKFPMVWKETYWFYIKQKVDLPTDIKNGDTLELTNNTKFIHKKIINRWNTNIRLTPIQPVDNRLFLEKINDHPITP
jgi:hypothetical protein